MLWRAYEAWQCGSVGQDASQMQPHLPCRPLSNPSLPCSKSCWQKLKGKTVSRMWCTDHAHRSAIQAWRTLGAAARLSCRFGQASPFWQPPLMWNLHTCHSNTIAVRHLMCCCQVLQQNVIDLPHGQDADDK